MPNSTALYDVSSLFIRCGSEEKAVLEYMIAINRDTVTFTVRIPGCDDTITASVPREMVEAFPVALDRARQLTTRN